MRFTRPHSYLELTGLPDATLTIEFDLQTDLVVPARGPSVLYDSISGAGYYILVGPKDHVDVRVNGVAATLADDFYGLVAGDTIEIDILNSGHAGSVRLFNSVGLMQPFYCDVGSLSVKQSGSIIHTFDLNNIDLATGVCPDSVGSGAVCTVYNGAFESQAVASQNTPVTAGQTFDVTVNDSALVAVGTLGGVNLLSPSVIDSNTLRYTAPVDGLELGATHELQVSHAVNPIEGLYGVNDFGDFWLSKNDCISATPPLTQGDLLLGLKGSLDTSSLLVRVGQVTYSDNNLTDPSSNRQLQSSIRIDPSINGISIFSCFSFIGTAEPVEPDLFWGLNHSYPGARVLNGTDDVLCYFTDNAADNFTLSGLGTGLPITLGFTFDPVGNTVTAYVNGVAQTPFTPVGTVPVSTDLTFLCGDRGGVTHDFWGAMVIDRELSTGEVTTLHNALLNGIRTDGGA